MFKVGCNMQEGVVRFLKLMTMMWRCALFDVRPGLKQFEHNIFDFRSNIMHGVIEYRMHDSCKKGASQSCKLGNDCQQLLAAKLLDER